MEDHVRIDVPSRRMDELVKIESVVDAFRFDRCVLEPSGVAARPSLVAERFSSLLHGLLIGSYTLLTAPSIFTA